VNAKAWIFLVLSVVGIIMPYSQMPAMLADGEYSLVDHFAAVYATPETAFFAWDLAVAALAFLVFLGFETRRIGVKFWWVALIGGMAVGVSFGLPFFLFLRERRLQALEAPDDGEAA
jgi:hypothetical protein